MNMELKQRNGFVRPADSGGATNWDCGACQLRFGALPDAHGLVTCPDCGATNAKQGHQIAAATLPGMITGVRPTGALHLGNHFGALAPYLREVAKGQHRAMIFVADLHSLTTCTSSECSALDALSVEIVRLYLAAGVDPDQVLIYRQSDVEAIPYIAQLLAMVAPLGEVMRCAAFKDKSEQLSQDGRGPSVGLLSYPVLMAADILAMNAAVVPVGADQQQHIEITREIARKYNSHYANQHRFTEPQAQEFAPVRVPGLHGAGKMSKSGDGGDDAVIYLMDPPAEVRRKVMAALTDSSTEADQPMSTALANLFSLGKLCSPPEVHAEFLERFQRGERRFYGAMKARLAADINGLLAPIQERYHSGICSPDLVRNLLFENAARARAIARRTLHGMLADFGFRRLALGVP